MGLQSNNLQRNTRLLFDLQALCFQTTGRHYKPTSNTDSRVQTSPHKKAGNTRGRASRLIQAHECHDPNVIDKTSMCGAAETTKLDTS